MSMGSISSGATATRRVELDAPEAKGSAAETRSAPTAAEIAARQPTMGDDALKIAGGVGALTGPVLLGKELISEQTDDE